MTIQSATKTIALALMAIGLNTSVLGQIRLTIDPSKTYQTIDNFAASDAWACQFVGNWPDEKKNKIADLLFSNNIYADGSPKGIGLSMWRFNIGAGSAEQEDASGIRDEWRRAESFLKTDGSYDWTKQAGQIWFLKAAKARGVRKFLGFTNSPPVQFTINGKAYASKGKVNIAPEHDDDFANYLAAVTKGVEQISKIKFDYISPVNEPQWDWSDGGQEGCPYTNMEMAHVVKAINKAFVKDKIESKIIIGEAGAINYLYAKGDKPGKGYQIADFFKPASSNYIGDFPGVAHTITAHSYFTTSPMTASVRDRKALADSVAKINGLNFWESEYCILGGNSGEMDGSHRDLGIDPALYLASVIHTDLAVANASAWQWWTAISAYDYKDGLIYIDKNKTNGNFYASKMLWVLGNYSRFIKPGAKRIAVNLSANGATNQLLVSAFKKDKNITLVIINPEAKDVEVDLGAEGDFRLKYDTMYTTSSTADLKAEKVSAEKVNLPGRSVVTITARLK